MITNPIEERNGNALQLNFRGGRSGVGGLVVCVWVQGEDLKDTNMVC